jgi:hypothetical protein
VLLCCVLLLLSSLPIMLLRVAVWYVAAADFGTGPVSL